MRQILYTFITALFVEKLSGIFSFYSLFVCRPEDDVGIGSEYAAAKHFCV